MQRPDRRWCSICRMPEMDGLAAIREIGRVAPDVAVLVLTMFDDEDSLFAAMRAGARGYVVKGAEQDEIAPRHPRGRGRRGDLLAGGRSARAALLRVTSAGAPTRSRS